MSRERQTILEAAERLAKAQGQGQAHVITLTNSQGQQLVIHTETLADLLTAAP